MKRQTSSIVISAYRATSVVDTPMRKVEVLEGADGYVIIRETDFSPGSRSADIALIHLRPHESQSLAKTLLNLEDLEPATEFPAAGPMPVGTNGDAA
jgi:hypothetical protein